MSTHDEGREAASALLTEYAEAVATFSARAGLDIRGTTDPKAHADWRQSVEWAREDRDRLRDQILARLAGTARLRDEFARRSQAAFDAAENSTSDEDETHRRVESQVWSLAAEMVGRATTVTSPKGPEDLHARLLDILEGVLQAYCDDSDDVANIVQRFSDALPSTAALRPDRSDVLAGLREALNDPEGPVMVNMAGASGPRIWWDRSLVLRAIDALATFPPTPGGSESEIRCGRCLATTSDQVTACEPCNTPPFTTDPASPEQGEGERRYIVDVEDGGTFTYDLIDVGRFAKRMAEQGDSRAFSIALAPAPDPNQEGETHA